MLDRLVAAGLLKGWGRQRAGATHVLAAVGRLSRLELADECLRAALFDKAVLVTDGRHVSSQGVARAPRPS